MNKILGASWKTSLAGFIGGMAFLFQDLFEKGETDMYKIAVAVAMFILGRVAGDHKTNA
jgi:hypothetical protein